MSATPGPSAEQMAEAHAEFWVSKAAWERQYERAEKAEAALAGLRARVEALAAQVDGWGGADADPLAASIRDLLAEDGA